MENKINNSNVSKKLKKRLLYLLQCTMEEEETEEIIEYSLNTFLSFMSVISIDPEITVLPSGEILAKWKLFSILFDHTEILRLHVEQPKSTDIP